LKWLFGLGLLAAICFSLSLELARFALDIYKDMDFNPSTPVKTLEYWRNLQVICWRWSWAFFGLLLIFLGLGSHKIRSIKKETQFDEVS
jgi:hypothetical protein